MKLSDEDETGRRSVIALVIYTGPTVPEITGLGGGTDVGGLGFDHVAIGG